MDRGTDDIKQFVFKTILQEKRIKSSTYNPNEEWFNMILTEDFEFDSLEIVEIIMDCEEMYGVSFSDKDILEVKTPNDIVQKIRNKIDSLS